jgi:hypothetical protein
MPNVIEEVLFFIASAGLGFYFRTWFEKQKIGDLKKE